MCGESRMHGFGESLAVVKQPFVCEVLHLKSCNEKRLVEMPA